MKATAKFYSENPKSKAKKDAYNKEYNKGKEATKKRSELNTINRKSQAAGKTKVGDKKDMSHTSRGIISKPQSVNRGSKKDSPGDRRARG